MLSFWSDLNALMEGWQDPRLGADVQSVLRRDASWSGGWKPQELPTASLDRPSASLVGKLGSAAGGDRFGALPTLHGSAQPPIVEGLQGRDEINPSGIPIG